MSDGLIPKEEKDKEKEPVRNDDREIKNNEITINNLLLFDNKDILNIPKIKYNEEELKEDIKLKLSPHLYSDPPKLYFKSSSIEDFFKKIEKIKINLEYFQEFINKCQNGEKIDDEIINKYNKFSNNLKDLLKDFAIEDKDITDNMTNLLKEIQNNLELINNGLENFIQEFKDEILTTIQDFNEIKNENSIFSLYCSLPSEPKLTDNYLTINFKELNNDFSLPIISENKKENKLECSYDKLIQEIGPLCPLFYSKPIIINFLIFIDDDLRIKVQNYEYINHDEKEEKEDKDEKEE